MPDHRPGPDPPRWHAERHSRLLAAPLRARAGTKSGNCTWRNSARAAWSRPASHSWPQPSSTSLVTRSQLPG